MNYPLAEAIIGFAAGEHLDGAVVASHDQWRLTVRTLDGPAFGGRLMELATAYDPDTTAVQFNLLGSHDTPRLRTVLGGDVAGVRLAALIQSTLPGAPCIYYGDEVGLEGGGDPGCRGAFPWDEARWEPGLHEAVRGLLRLRAAEPALRDAPLRVVGAEGSAVAYERGSGASRFVVAVNAGESEVRLGLDFADAPGGAGWAPGRDRAARVRHHRGDADRRWGGVDRARRPVRGRAPDRLAHLV